MSIDTARLQKSWAVAAQFGDQVPLFFYSSQFVAHPGLRDMFPPSMEAQRDKLVAALGSVVLAVDDLPAVVPVLEQLGRDDRRFAVVRDHYPAVGEALPATLEHFLGDDWTDELAADWALAYQLVADVMIAAADSAGGDSPPWYEATVADIERRSASVAVLRVTPTVEIPYRAGQSLATEIPAGPACGATTAPPPSPTRPGASSFKARFGRVPKEVTADRSYSEAAIEDEVRELGVTTVAILRKGRPSAARRQIERSSRFRRLIKWRSGGEGRISYLKRGFGCDRTLLDGIDGAQTWCAFGILAHNAVIMTRLIDQRDRQLAARRAQPQPEPAATGPPARPDPGSLLSADLTSRVRPRPHASGSPKTQAEMKRGALPWASTAPVSTDRALLFPGHVARHSTTARPPVLLTDVSRRPSFRVLVRAADDASGRPRHLA